MRVMTVVITCWDNGESFDVTTETSGSDAPSTIEVLGLIELAKSQFIDGKQAMKTIVGEHGDNTQA